MAKIKATVPFSGPFGAPIPGQVIEVPDEYAASLVATNRAEYVEEDSKTTPKPKAKRTRKAKTETPEAKADDVETATEEA